MARNPKPLRKAWKRAKRDFARKCVPVSKINFKEAMASGCIGSVHGFSFYNR